LQAGATVLKISYWTGTFETNIIERT